MSKLLIHNGMCTPLFVVAEESMLSCDVLLDVGCGIRPQNMLKCKRHICVEPHGEYVEVLKSNGYEVINKLANDALRSDIGVDVDTVMALDVIEHMEKADGIEFIRLALQKAKKQVVVFTPLGFMPQEETDEKDAWGMNGHEFQRHKSGWLPEEFPGWQCIVEQRFHNRKGTEYGAFFAIFTV